MKQVAICMLTVGALASFSAAFAEPPSAPITRAQVRADLLRIEQAGYNPAANNDPYYPADIQAAEAKVAAEDAARKEQQLAVDSVGGTPRSGAPYAGKRDSLSPARSTGLGQ
ncbi:DUF4148 domain-containing protein [Trinickia sp. EG282A]|uniref:DUF4148 domain-containing protein n=1 Tax=Trinickia sp. EG282A TaxID=3237013 RepID=UPI0034D18F0F